MLNSAERERFPDGEDQVRRPFGEIVPTVAEGLPLVDAARSGPGSADGDQIFLAT
ncbi:hypothetical protein AB0G54_25305 [Streptomyces yokosukanensis]|uniref:hypothetical protein n=1 Tax=Streptomyces yokosukanensis TaxID=67386 RepID=UPI0034454627